MLLLRGDDVCVFHKNGSRSFFQVREPEERFRSRETCTISSMLPQAPRRVPESNEGRTQRALNVLVRAETKCNESGSMVRTTFCRWLQTSWVVIRSLNWAWSNKLPPGQGQRNIRARLYQSHKYVSSVFRVIENASLWAASDGNRKSKEG